MPLAVTSQREKEITKLKAELVALRETAETELALIRTALINGLPISESAVAGENGIQNSQILKQAVLQVILLGMIGCMAILFTALILVVYFHD